MPKIWHTISLQEIFAESKSSPSGLAAAEAAKRLKKFGRNTLPQEKPYSKLLLFLRQFNNPLMYILLTAVAISFALREYADSIFIVVVLLINTVVGFYQENKANQALLALKRLVRIRARVWRDGELKEIDSEELVIGDVISLKAGDKVPADGRILEAKGLKVNEASLTGEWQAVEKTPGELSPGAPVAERSNMVFMSTIVEEGSAKAVMVATGLKTQIGEVVSLLKETRERPTPLQQKLATLSKLTGAFIMFLAAVVVIAGYFAGKSLTEMFVASLALAVSAIPEGLLPGITIILVLGMRRILKQNGLVRKLIANETLGSVTVICTDKTGTLTEAKMQVSQILTGQELLETGGPEAMKLGAETLPASHTRALQIAVLDNEAFIENPEAGLEEWVIRGRPTEQALLLAGLQAGLNEKELRRQYPLLDRMSFNSELKYAATLHKKDERNNVLFVMGAPEELIVRANSSEADGAKVKLSSNQISKIFNKLDGLTGRGLRVVACAYRSYARGTKYQNLSELADELTLVGFITLKDPLRREAKEAIKKTRRAGIKPIIITGDHKFTAKAVAEELGLLTKSDYILEGKDLEAISDEALRDKAKHITIYARVSPRHKLRIVKALQANGEVVAMLGDGVNDAPALKAADIGVALGSGTDVAKEVSDLVLLDDNFQTVVNAIEQGRVIFSNIRKVFTYLIADDFLEIFLFLANMAAGLPIPLLPAQILWINLVEDGLPNAALTTEQETVGVMEEKPRDPKEPFLHKPLRRWMAAVFLIMGIATFLTFLAVWKLTGDLRQARTVIFALTILDSLIFAFSTRSFKRTIFRRDIFSNRYLTAAVLFGFALLVAALHLPPLQKLLSAQPLGAADWFLILGVVFIEMTLVEFAKKKCFIRNA